MKLLTTITLLIFMQPTHMLYDFTAESDPGEWMIIDDGVMGGRSRGNYQINEQGHGDFSGKVSLENNGGFSLMRYRSERIDVTPYQTLRIRLRGDGKRYQARVKSKPNQRHSYIYSFNTTGKWEVVEIPLGEMTPSFRGINLPIPDFPGKTIAEMGILIGNNKEEAFHLEMDWIALSP